MNKKRQNTYFFTVIFSFFIAIDFSFAGRDGQVYQELAPEQIQGSSNCYPDLVSITSLQDVTFKLKKEEITPEIIELRKSLSYLLAQITGSTGLASINKVHISQDDVKKEPFSLLWKDISEFSIKSDLFAKKTKVTLYHKKPLDKTTVTCKEEVPGYFGYDHIDPVTTACWPRLMMRGLWCFNCRNVDRYNEEHDTCDDCDCADNFCRVSFISGASLFTYPLFTIVASSLAGFIQLGALAVTLPCQTDWEPATTIEVQKYNVNVLKNGITEMEKILNDFDRTFEDVNQKMNMSERATPQ